MPPPPAPRPDPWSHAAELAARDAEVDAGSDPADDTDGGHPDVDATGAPSPGEAHELPTTARRVVAVVAASIVAGLVVAIAAVTFLGGRDDGMPAALPESVDELWSVDLEGRLGPGQVAVIDEAVVVLEGDDVIALDRSTGEERWRRSVRLDAEVPTVGEVAPGVVAVVDLAGGGARAVALDVDTGVERWRRTSPEYSIFVQDGVLVEVAYDDAGGRDRFGTVALLDPLTGRPETERFDVVSVGGSELRVGVAVEGGTRLLDLEQRMLIGPVIETPGVRSLVAVGDAIVGVDADDELVLFGATGEEVDRVTTSGVFSLDTVPDGETVVAVGEASLGVRVAATGLDVAWSREGAVRTIAATDDGPRAILFDDRGDLSIIDPVSGDTVAAFDGEISPVGSSRGQLWRNGVAGPDDGDLVAWDLDGRERWRIPGAGGRDDGFVIDDGIVVTYGRGGLTAYG